MWLYPRHVSVAIFTSTQHQSDFRQHATLIGKVHLPFSSQPSHHKSLVTIPVPGSWWWPPCWIGYTLRTGQGSSATGERCEQWSPCQPSRPVTWTCSRTLQSSQTRSWRCRPNWHCKQDTQRDRETPEVVQCSSCNTDSTKQVRSTKEIEKQRDQYLKFGHTHKRGWSVLYQPNGNQIYANNPLWLASQPSFFLTHPCTYRHPSTPWTYYRHPSSTHHNSNTLCLP